MIAYCFGFVAAGKLGQLPSPAAKRKQKAITIKCFLKRNINKLPNSNYQAMAMTIKTSPVLRGEDAQNFIEEADRNGKLPTPKLSASQRKVLTTMLESAKNIIFPPHS